MQSPDFHELGILLSGHLCHMQTKQRLANTGTAGSIQWEDKRGVQV